MGRLLAGLLRPGSRAGKATASCAFLSCTLCAEKIQSTTDAGSLNAFGRNEIENCAYFIGTSSHCVFSNTIRNLSCRVESGMIELKSTFTLRLKCHDRTRFVAHFGRTRSPSQCAAKRAPNEQPLRVPRSRTRTNAAQSGEPTCPSN